MKRYIIINWKWMPVAPCQEGAALAMEDVQCWKTPQSDEEIWCLNLPREEAAFEDEYDFYYDEPNELLWNFIQQEIGEHGEVLLLLHKNTPHFYGAYDLRYFIQEGLNHVATFGGGEDMLYDLQNPKGLLDQVGNFSQKAVLEEGLIRQSHFDSIWEHYVEGLKSMLHQFSRKVLPYLLPTTAEALPKPLQKEALALLKAIEGNTEGSIPPYQQQALAKMDWSMAFIETLKALSEGEKAIDAKLFRNTIDAIVYQD